MTAARPVLHGTAEIPLTRGFVALVDVDDVEEVLAAGRWHARVRRHTTYAARNIVRPDGRRSKLDLHTFLTGWPRVDHINCDGLDNRRANLRRATHAENQRNRRPQANNTSGFKGVCWVPSRGRWQAKIVVDSGHLFLGRFGDPVEAARAYDQAALVHHGEFARLNFPGVTR